MMFFNSESLLPSAALALQNALTTDPKTVDNVVQQAHNMASQVSDQVNGVFAWGRFIAAVLFLALLFIGGIYTAQHIEMQDWSAALLHTFEVTLGGVVGIVIGEKNARS